MTKEIDEIMNEEQGSETRDSAMNPEAITNLGSHLPGFTIQNLPDLSKAEPSGIDLVSEYWAPQKEGESKRVFFVEVTTGQEADEHGELKEVTTVYFVERDKDGNLKGLRQRSARLVGAFTDRNVQQGTPFEITYLGKKQNTTNQYKSDHWSVVPLATKG